MPDHVQLAPCLENQKPAASQTSSQDWKRTGCLTCLICVPRQTGCSDTPVNLHSHFEVQAKFRDCAWLAGATANLSGCAVTMRVSTPAGPEHVASSYPRSLLDCFAVRYSGPNKLNSLVWVLAAMPVSLGWKLSSRVSATLPYSIHPHNQLRDAGWPVTVFVRKHGGSRDSHAWRQIVGIVWQLFDDLLRGFVSAEAMRPVHQSPPTRDPHGRRSGTNTISPQPVGL